MNWELFQGLPWVAFGVTWLVSAAFTNRTVRRQSAGVRLAYMVPLVVGCWLMFAIGPHHFLPQRFVPATDTTQAVGFALTVLGLGFAIWARFHLGRMWSGSVTLKEGHRLVQSGPYGLVRHPIYTGLVTAWIGRAVSAGTVRALVGLALAVGSIVYKLSFEDRLMAENFGEEHADYRRRVKRLVPFVW
jgi:protein-S-isoprenylcysteine O-methyltransferase Ste14